MKMSQVAKAAEVAKGYELTKKALATAMLPAVETQLVLTTYDEKIFMRPYRTEVSITLTPSETTDLLAYLRERRRAELTGLGVALDE